jgi:hypothetical protein
LKAWRHPDDVEAIEQAYSIANAHPNLNSPILCALAHRVRVGDVR